MARQGTHTIPKFLRLARRFNSFPIAAGVLELMWSAAHSAADDYLGSFEDLAARVHWEGPADDLGSALLETGWIDSAAPRPGFKIHDYWDHAPDYVRKKLKLEEKRWAMGKTLSQVRAEAGRLGAEIVNRRRVAKEQERAVIEQQMVGKRPANSQPFADLLNSQQNQQSDFKTESNPTFAANVGEVLPPILPTDPSEEKPANVRQTSGK